MNNRFRPSSATAALVALLLVAACSSPTTNTGSIDPATPTQTPPDATAAPTSTAAAPTSSAAAAPTSSAAAAPSGSPSALVIPLAFACDAMDAKATERIIGGPIALANEWEPGDQPFGEAEPPSSLYGCRYALAEDEPSPTFEILIPGAKLSDDDWAARTSDLDDCRDLAAPEGIVGDAVMARVCPANPEGWSRIVLTGLFGGTGVKCDLFVADDSIDAALEETVIEECRRIILDLSGRT